MEEIIQRMKTRANTLKKAIARAEKDKKTFPEGRLRVSMSNNRTRYYLVDQPGDTQGKYLTKDQMHIATLLAQKNYNLQFLKQASWELAKLEQIISQLSQENSDLIYQNLPEHRKSLVTPYLLSEDFYAKEWQSQVYKTNPYLTEKKIYDTKRGEKVRSKSEAIIADILYELDIPYHYEKALKLKGDIVRYPDFTLLKRKTGEEIYLEHFGLWDQEEYRNESLRKLDEYRENSIYLGKNLLFTYETQESPLDIKGIRKMLKSVIVHSSTYHEILG